MKIPTQNRLRLHKWFAWYPVYAEESMDTTHYDANMYFVWLENVNRIQMFEVGYKYNYFIKK